MDTFINIIPKQKLLFDSRSLVCVMRLRKLKQSSQFRRLTFVLLFGLLSSCTMAPPALKKAKKDTAPDKTLPRKPRAKKMVDIATVGAAAIAAATPPSRPVFRKKKSTPVQSNPPAPKVPPSKPPPERVPKKKKPLPTSTPPKKRATKPATSAIASSSHSRELAVSTTAVVSPPPASSQLQAPPVTNLAAFGLVHGADAPHARTADSRNSSIHCAVVEGLLHWFLFFYVQSLSITNPNNSWAEKLFSDALKKQLPWIVAMGICDRTYQLHIRNVAIKNAKGYFVRVFLICTQGARPPRQSLLHLGNHICAQLNAIKGNDTITSLDEQTFFWLGEDDVVWADVVGSDEAYKLLLKETNTAVPLPGFYEEHATVIHTYFRPMSFSKELLANLHAPENMLHDSLRASPRAPESPPTSLSTSSNSFTPTKKKRTYTKKPKPIAVDLSEEASATSTDIFNIANTVKPVRARAKRAAKKKPAPIELDFSDDTSEYEAEEEEEDEEDEEEDGDNSFIDNNSYQDVRGGDGDDDDDSCDEE
jgi:hypothetical protein